MKKIPESVHTCHDIPDLLGLLPTLFGFVPEESVIAVAVDGPRSRFGFRLRTDLPQPHEADGVAELVSRHMRKHRPDAVILIVVSEDHARAEPMMKSLITAIAPIPIKLAVSATSTMYWRWDGGDPISAGEWDCRAQSPAVAKAVLSGQQIVSSRAELEARYAPVSGTERAQMRAATDRAVAGIGSQVDGYQLTDPTPNNSAISQVKALVLRGLDGNSALSHDDRALLSVWMNVPAARDEVLGDISRANANVHAQLWTSVAQCVVPPLEAPVLTLAGLCRWLCGDGAQALMALERALEADPDFMFARTLMEALQQGLDPQVWDRF